jgi:uncharacterized cupredoxin-like copper-binding protein
MRKALITTMSLLAIALGVSACGSSSPSSSATTGALSAPTSSAPSHVVSLSAATSGALMFSTTSLHALAGKVTIHFTNQAPESHNFTLATTAGKTVAATPTFMGGTKTLVVTLSAGKYTYFCSVPGHRQAGMQGTLTVS